MVKNQLSFAFLVLLGASSAQADLYDIMVFRPNLFRDSSMRTAVSPGRVDVQMRARLEHLRVFGSIKTRFSFQADGQRKAIEKLYRISLANYVKSFAYQNMRSKIPGTLDLSKGNEDIFTSGGRRAPVIYEEELFDFDPNDPTEPISKKTSRNSQSEEEIRTDTLLGKQIFDAARARCEHAIGAQALAIGFHLEFVVPTETTSSLKSIDLRAKMGKPKESPFGQVVDEAYLALTYSPQDLIDDGKEAYQRYHSSRKKNYFEKITPVEIQFSKLYCYLPTVNVRGPSLESLLEKDAVESLSSTNSLSAAHQLKKRIKNRVKKLGSRLLENLDRLGGRMLGHSDLD